MSEATMMVFLAFCFGFIFGRWGEAHRWSSNADRTQRIEWRGKLYKVSHD